MHCLIDAAGLQNDVKIISSIYDSIYFEVTADPSIIKWTNDNLIACMTKDFMLNQRIKNTAESEIGLNWAELLSIPNNADELTISMTLDIALNKLQNTKVVNHKFISTYQIDKESKVVSNTLDSIEQVIEWQNQQIKAYNDTTKSK